MTGLGGVLAIAAAIFGPDGFAVHRRILAVPESAIAAPVDELLAVADGSWVVWHRQRSWARAFYSPPEDSVLLLAVAAGAGSVERLLPGLEIPRLFLHAPTYRPEGTAVGLSAQAVDVAENYYHALVELYLDHQLRQPRSWFRRLAADRAGEVMAEVPAVHRLEAYADAVSAFAAHLLSIAHEIGRADRRAAARGEDLCALLDPPRTLFGLWRRSVRSGIYRGRYPHADDGGGSPALATSRHGLAETDKRRILDELFDGRWTGEPVEDFAYLCQPAPGD